MKGGAVFSAVLLPVLKGGTLQMPGPGAAKPLAGPVCGRGLYAESGIALLAPTNAISIATAEEGTQFRLLYTVPAGSSRISKICSGAIAARHSAS